MAKIRHIAIRSVDPEATAAFFQQAFGLEVVLRRDYGPIDLSDGAAEPHGVQLGGACCESKFQAPDGLVVDVGHWRGAAPLPGQPAVEAQPAQHP